MDLNDFGTAVEQRPQPLESPTECVKGKDDSDSFKGMSLTQWASAGPNKFLAIGETYPVLQGGVYTMYDSQHGMVFEHINVCVDEFLEFPNAKTGTILAEIDAFWKKGVIFSNFGFLHRRGFLLYGPAGGGKTVLVQQVIARVVKNGGIVFMCKKPSWLSEGLQVFRRVEPKRPVVCVYEDIDALVDRHGESDILSVLDGENQIDRVLNIACPSPEMRILKSDLTWVKAGDLNMGDELIAFDEYAPAGGWQKKGENGRKFRTATVTGCSPIVKPRFRVTTENSEVIVSEKHPFLVKIGNRPLAWRFVEELNPGNRVASLGKPWETDHSHGGGYLAGQYDGEGCLNYSHCDSPHHGFTAVWVQSDGPLIEVMQSLLKEKGFSTSFYRRPMTGGGAVPKGRYKPQTAIHIRGGRWESLRFLGSIRPLRLLLSPRLDEAWEGARLSPPLYDKVVSVEKIGNGTVIALGTTTKTFIGEGLFQHNTTNYPEKLDKRIVGRPRRFDRVIKIEMPEDDVRRVYFKHKLKIDDGELEEWVRVTNGFSFAAMAELVISVKCFDHPLKASAETLTKLMAAKASSREFDDSKVGFGGNK